jgi:hypothetical protein
MYIYIGSNSEEIGVGESSRSDTKNLDRKLNEIRILLHELKEVDEGICGEAEWKDNIERSELQANNTRHEISKIDLICGEHKDKMLKEQKKTQSSKADMEMLCRVKRYKLPQSISKFLK